MKSTSTSPPTGTVTFLFTDIEGSTLLAQQYPAELPTLLNQHHTILRQSIQSNNGHIFQIIGDAYCAAFHTATEAVKNAVHAQRQLQQVSWQPAILKVRMGIHTGSAQVVNGEGVANDYTGYLTLARAQRIMSTAYGGQVLVSNTSAELLLGGLPEGIQLRDLGEHRMKGLLNPEHIWQIIATDLPSEFPPLISLNTIPSNLPVQLNSFIGRKREIAEVIRLLKTTRLLTLTGPPGIGKTRLGIQVASELVEHFKDGVWFVPLAPIHEPGLVARTITQTEVVR